MDYGDQLIFHNGNCTTSADSICRTWRYPNGMQINAVKVYGTWDITTAWGSVYSSPYSERFMQDVCVVFTGKPRSMTN